VTQDLQMPQSVSANFAAHTKRVTQGHHTPASPINVSDCVPMHVTKSLCVQNLRNEAAENPQRSLLLHVQLSFNYPKQERRPILAFMPAKPYQTMRTFPTTLGMRAAQKTSRLRD